MRDLEDFHTHPPPGIFIQSDENNIVNHIVLIIGPEGTPYEGGFFLFELRFPSDYPFQPPKVEIRTQDPTGTMRFNPNLYINGKVCLSILGTWSGPKWSPVQSLSTCLLSIRSLLNEMPLENEPGFEKVGNKQKLAYNEAVTQLVLKESVIRQLSGALPKTKMHSRSDLDFKVFLPQMRDHFRENYDNYLKKVDGMRRERLKIRLDAHEHRPTPDKIRKDLQGLHDKLFPATTTPHINNTSTNSTELDGNDGDGEGGGGDGDGEGDGDGDGNGDAADVCILSKVPVKVTRLRPLPKLSQKRSLIN